MKKPKEGAKRMKAKGDARLREKPKEKAEEKIPVFFGQKACVKKSKEGCKANESKRGCKPA